MKTGCKVMDAMTKEPIEVASGTTLQECSKIMANSHVGSLVVMENNELLGLITEQDIVRKAVAVGLDTEKTNVGEIMIRKLTVIEPEKDIYDAILLMNHENLRRLPVVINGRVIGLITLRDILTLQPTLFDLILDMVDIKKSRRM